MLYNNQPKSVFLYTEPVDFRKQINGLGIIVESEFPHLLARGHWFAFVSKDKKKIKILYWRQTGFALWHFKLESNSFNLGYPRRSSRDEIRWNDLKNFISGLNIFSGSPHREVIAKKVS